MAIFSFQASRAADLAAQALQHRAQAEQLRNTLAQEIQPVLGYLKSKGHGSKFELRYTAAQSQTQEIFRTRDFTRLDEIAEKVRKLGFDARCLKRKVAGKQLVWLEQNLPTHRDANHKQRFKQVAKKINIEMQQLIAKLNQAKPAHNYNKWLVNYEQQLNSCYGRAEYIKLDRLERDVNTVIEYLRAEIDEQTASKVSLH